MTASLQTKSKPTVEPKSLPTEAAPVRWRELLAVALAIPTVDAFLYTQVGFAGFGAFLIVFPLLLVLGAVRPHFSANTWFLGGLLLLAALKSTWFGDPALVVAALAMLTAFAMSLYGLAPYALEVPAFALQAPAAAIAALIEVYPRTLMRFSGWRIGSRQTLATALPVAACLTFGALFVMANPDVAGFLGERFERALRQLNAWSAHLLPTPGRCACWTAALLFTCGFIRPLFQQQLMHDNAAETPTESASTDLSDGMILALRNSFISLIALFSVYLVFEFATLWFREFPEGFYYAGYAHEGAFWLTMALALATAVLSWIFRLLAAAVYNRLFIYIDFNGLTRMRIVGLFGSAAVVAGLVLVIVKIANRESFFWLVQRQLWALALTVFAFILLPADWWAMQHNSRRVLQGDVAACMAIGVKPFDCQGVFPLLRLLECDDEQIRLGVRARLANVYWELKEKQSLRPQHWAATQWPDSGCVVTLRVVSLRPQHWAATQWAPAAALAALESRREQLQPFLDDKQLRAQQTRDFDEYARRWY